jgi:hypothetical protein
MSAADHLNPQQFYHGTRYKFTPGTELSTGAAPRGNQGYGATDKVYYTSDRRLAMDYALNAYGPKGNTDAPARVYQVNPMAGHEPDPNEDPGTSFRADSVRVVRQSGKPISF